MLPPDADVKPTDSPGSEPTGADFEDCGWCEWSEDSGLNSEENFVWNRTTGAEQDGVIGPSLDYDSTATSNYKKEPNENHNAALKSRYSLFVQVISFGLLDPEAQLR